MDGETRCGLGLRPLFHSSLWLRVLSVLHLWPQPLFFWILESLNATTWEKNHRSKFWGEMVGVWRKKHHLSPIKLHNRGFCTQSIIFLIIRNPYAEGKSKYSYFLLLNHDLNKDKSQAITFFFCIRDQSSGTHHLSCLTTLIILSNNSNHVLLKLKLTFKSSRVSTAGAL